MSYLQKQLLGWLAIGLILVTGIYLVVSTNQKVNTATTTNTVSFNGEGKVLAKPDVAVTNLSIVTTADTSKAAQDQNSKKSNTVVDFLKKQGISSDDIKTTSYNIQPQYKYTPYGGNPSIVGYQVYENMEVKIRDLEKVSSILDGVVSAGVNQVNGLTYKIDNPDKLKAKAREEAIKDAKKKAGELESQLGISLGKIVNFQESGSGYPTPIYYASDMMGKGMGGGGGPSVPEGQNEIVVNVMLVYQIK